MIWVTIYDDNIDFIALGVIIITCINSVGLLLFSTFGSTSGWLLVWTLQSPEGASASDIPVLPHDQHVESLTGQEALPDAWNFVQFPHACWSWGCDVFHCCCG